MFLPEPLYSSAWWGVLNNTTGDILCTGFLHIYGMLRRLPFYGLNTFWDLLAGLSMVFQKEHIHSRYGSMNWHKSIMWWHNSTTPLLEYTVFMIVLIRLVLFFCILLLCYTARLLRLLGGVCVSQFLTIVKELVGNLSNSIFYMLS